MLGAWASGDMLVHRATVNQAAKEVFGSETVGKGTTGKRRTRVALTALMLLLCAAVGAMAVWSNTSKPQPSTPASAPAH
jgi:hypothetical protein